MASLTASASGRVAGGVAARRAAAPQPLGVVCTLEPSRALPARLSLAARAASPLAAALSAVRRNPSVRASAAEGSSAGASVAVTDGGDGGNGDGSNGGNGGNGGDGEGEGEGEGESSEPEVVEVAAVKTESSGPTMMMPLAIGAAVALGGAAYTFLGSGTPAAFAAAKKGQKEPEAPSAPPSPTGIDLYSRFALAGALCCAVSHGALTPVDVVKTRIQLEPTVYNKGLLMGMKQVVEKEGAAALLTGLAPTAFGYFLQGAFKFGGYEFFKKQWVDNLGMEEAKKNRTAIYLASSASAEFFADLALCPLEATRIRLVSNPSYAKGLGGCAARMLKEEGLIRGFYSGFVPMLFKQIPYTMAKFVVFETLSEAIYKNLPTPKEKLSGPAVTAVNLGSGVGAGVVAAIISQPADTLLSKINKAGAGGTGSTGSRLLNIAKDLGVKGLFAGTGARCVMVGAITAAQFAIYGEIKKVLNATGGTDISK